MVMMVDSTDHVTGKTGLTLTITASKDGGAFGSIAPTVTERGNGWYNLALTASHTDTLGDLALHITGTAADPTDMVILVEGGATDADISAIPVVVWDEVLTKVTHNVANSAGKIVRQLKGAMTHDGTAQAGGVNTITLAVGASAVDNIYKEGLIVIVAGTAVGEAHHILSYNGTTKVAVVDQSWYAAPDITSDYIVFGGSAHDTSESGLAAGGSSTGITLNGSASAVDGTYTNQIVLIPSGAGTGQVRKITGYVGATKVATVSPAWTTTPDATSGYMVYPYITASTAEITAAVLAGAAADPIAANIKEVNSIVVDGNGQPGTEWGPV